jgi:hypothetical protein
MFQALFESKKNHQAMLKNTYPFLSVINNTFRTARTDDVLEAKTVAL